MMRLATLLDPELLEPNLSGCTKMEAVDHLLSLIARKDNSINIQEVRSKILEREGIEDTSYGHGFAFPHARTDAVSKMYLALGVSPEGVEHCKDGSHLEVVCLLLTPSNISKLYLQTLSALASFAREIGNLDKLKGARSSYEILDIIWQSGVMVQKKITVGDLMRFDPVVAHEKQSLKEIANMLFRHRLSGLPVVDSKNVLLGHVTDRDLLTAALPEYTSYISCPECDLPGEPFEELLKRADQIAVEQLYQVDHETVRADEDIVRVSARMISGDLRRVYVVEDGGKLVGVLHRKEIVNMILRG